MTYTVRDLVQRYGVTEHTVLGWINRGELQAINVGRAPGKLKPRWRITEEALAAFELRRSKGPKPQTNRCKRRTSSGVIERY